MRGKNIKICGLHLIFILVFIVNRDVSAQEARPTEQLLQEVGPISKITPEESESRMTEAKLLFDRGKTDAAIFLLQQLEKADPTNYEVLFKLGEMAIADRNWAYSISVLRKASFIRPNDIEVRLILIDIYKAYQMPIQGIIVAKEILVLDPQHLTGTKRLAELYKEQAMLEDEIEIRLRLRRLEPDGFENLKRLASIYYESGDLWEAAKVYEEIRIFYPKKIKVLTQLVAIYDKLGESFRELQIIKLIEENGNRRNWLKDRSVKNLRKQTNLADLFLPRALFRRDKSEELRTSYIIAETNYTHRPLLSSFDVGLKMKLESITYEGLGVLDGDAAIRSGTLVFYGLKNWPDKDYRLVVSAGLIVDLVSGSLFPRDINSGTTSDDFPFLKDPSFNSYGGELPIGSLNFSAKPGLHSTYLVKYEHGLVPDLDARLELFYFDKATINYSYQTTDRAELSFSIDESAVSDNNSRFHQLMSANYTLWGSHPTYDYNGARKGFFRNPPSHFLMLGYSFEYFNDHKKSKLYQTYQDEIRNKGKLSGQANIMRVAPGEYIIVGFGYAYSTGSTLKYKHNGDLKLLLSDTDSGRELSLSSTYVKSFVVDASQLNQRIVGKSEGYTVALNFKMQF